MSNPQFCAGCNAPLSTDPMPTACPWCGQAIASAIEIVDLGESEAVPPTNPPAEDVVDLGDAAAPEPAPRELEKPLPAPKLTRRQRSPGREREPAHRPPAKSGSGKTMLVVAIVGGFLFLGCGGVATLGYYFLGRSADVVQRPKAFESPVTAPPRIMTATAKEAAPIRPAWERDWAPLVQASGFQVRVPIGANGGAQTAVVSGETLKGQRHTVEEAGIEYRVEWYDLPATITISPGQIARQIREKAEPRVTHQAGPSPAMLEGRQAEEITYRGLAGQQEVIRALRVGPRLFLFGVAHDPARRFAFTGLIPEARQRQFFDSVRISFDPKTPAPASTKLEPEVTQPGVTLTRITALLPHSAAVYLPGTAKLLTFASRSGASPGLGNAYRYDLPSFKQAAQIGLSKPVSHAVVDEKAGRLYVAHYTPGPGVDSRDRLDTIGDLQAYEVAPFLGSPPTSPPVPVRTFKLGARVTALELAPDGRSLYVAAFYPAAAPGERPKSKLLKLALPALESEGELDMAIPILGARLSPDGKFLFAFEHPVNQVGQAVFGSAATADVRVIDAVGWKSLRHARLPGLASDLRFIGKDRALVIVTTANRPRLCTVGAVNGDVLDVTPTSGLKSLQAGYLGFAAGRIMTSARIPGTSGAEVLAVRPTAQPSSLAFESVLGSDTLSGPVLMTPDGRYAVFASGTTVEIKGGK